MDMSDVTSSKAEACLPRVAPDVHPQSKTYLERQMAAGHFLKGMSGRRQVGFLSAAPS